MAIIDVHAHGGDKLPAAIVSGNPSEVKEMLSRHRQGLFSVGIHPWATQVLSSSELDAEFGLLRELALENRVVAIGETGLDTLRGAALDIQERVFREHVALSESVGKPLVLHVVRTGSRIVELCKVVGRGVRGMDGLTQPWIWHGFRGNAAQAQQFMRLRQCNCLSIGMLFNEEAVRSIPVGRLLVETDGRHVDVEAVIDRVAMAIGKDTGCLRGIVGENMARLFPHAVAARR